MLRVSTWILPQLPSGSVLTAEIVTLASSMLAGSRVGHLSFAKRAALDHALRYALDKQCSINNLRQ